MLVEGDATDGNESESGQERWLKTAVPRRRQVADVVNYHIGDGGDSKAAGPRRPPHGGENEGVS